MGRWVKLIKFGVSYRPTECILLLLLLLLLVFGTPSLYSLQLCTYLIRITMAQVEHVEGGHFRRITKEGKLRKVKHAEIYKVTLETEKGICKAVAKEFNHVDPRIRKREYDKERNILQKIRTCKCM